MTGRKMLSFIWFCMFAFRFLNSLLCVPTQIFLRYVYADPDFCVMYAEPAFSLPVMYACRPRFFFVKYAGPDFALLCMPSHIFLCIMQVCRPRFFSVKYAGPDFALLWMLNQIFLCYAYAGPNFTLPTQIFLCYVYAESDFSLICIYAEPDFKAFINNIWRTRKAMRCK